MRPRVLVLLCAVASVVPSCGDDDGAADPIDAAPPDAEVFVYQPSNLDQDDFGQANGMFVVGATATVEINTDDLTVSMQPIGVGAPRVQSQDPDQPIAVFRFQSIAIDGTLEVTGSRLLALVASGDASIAGTISFSADGNQSCGLVTTGVVAGGGGGGFGSAGGEGGNGGGAPGPSRGNPELSPLVAGCNGGPGIGQATSSGGAGGGALQISAGKTITVRGTVCASGFGGRSRAGTGGGAGGSGGAILLEGRDIVAEPSAALATNGGGGGGGGGGAAAGDSGEASCDPGTAAAGGPSGGANSGAGGAGGSGSGVGVNGASGVDVAVDPGGGGGGGVGRIRINTRSGSAQIAGAGISGAITEGQLTPR